MAFLSNTGPTPAPTPGGSGYDVAAAAEKFLAIQGGATGVNTPTVPLWLARPATPTLKPARKAAKTVKTYGRLEGNEGNASMTPGDRWVDPNAFSNPMESTHARTLTEDAAAMYWFDMSDEERRAFAEKAVKAGLWEPKDGADNLLAAWTRAVDMASTYNKANANDKEKWLSPWEALDKLYAAGVAGAGGVLDGIDGPFKGWRSNTSKLVRTFSEDEIQATATQILQQELGRDPSKEELKAFTIAANRQASLQPQIVTERSRDTAWDEQGRPIDSETERTVEGEAYDPSMDMLDQVRGSEEQKAVKMATDYFNATMQALGAIA